MDIEAMRRRAEELRATDPEQIGNEAGCIPYFDELHVAMVKTAVYVTTEVLLAGIDGTGGT